MAIQKLPVVSAKQVGKNFNVTVGEETLTIVGTKETLAPVKEAVKLYLDKGTKKNLESLMSLLKPKTTEIKKEKEAKVEKVKAEIKAEKKKKVVEKKTKPAVKELEVKSLISKVADMSEKEIQELQEAINKTKKVEKNNPASSSPTRRSGEH